MNQIISIENLGDALDMLYDARYKWFDIGLALKVNYSTLKTIEKEQLNNQDSSLREMLAYRIQSGDSLTWCDLSDCLTQPSVGKKELAERIKTLKCK